MMNSKGYSIAELVIVMAVFIIVIMISSFAFENLLKKGGQQARSAETQIAGVVGLEMMRADIVHAGYGLPWSLQVTPASAFTEVSASPVAGLGVDATTFNDTTPRAVLSQTSTTTAIDYLVVKSTAVGMSQAARKWSYLNYAFGGLGNVSYIKTKGDPTDLQVNDRVITINSGVTPSGAQTKELRMVSDSNFSHAVPAGFVPSLDTYKPVDPTQTFLVYGINSTAESTGLAMPYNRVDFFIDKSAPKPASCNPGTGVLFKAVANHEGGYTKLPLLDCVGDMQVVYERDNGGNIAYTDESVVSLLDAEQVRTQIKNTRVYILAQEGKKDSGFTYPVSDAAKAIIVGPPEAASSGRVWSQSALAAAFGADWKNYRWKVYSIVVNLKNLQ